MLSTRYISWIHSEVSYLFSQLEIIQYTENVVVPINTFRFQYSVSTINNIVLNGGANKPFAQKDYITYIMSCL